MTSAPTQAPDATRFAHLDGMRCFAVMIVVLSHAGLTFVPGGSGVTIFFVISGFIITHLVLGEARRTGRFDARAFYLKRGLKLFPPFLVVIGIPTLVYALVRPVSALDVTGQFLFFFNWLYTDSVVDVMPGSIVVWSLSIEEQFYLAFALLWIVLVRSRRATLILAFVAGGAALVSAGSRVLLHLADATQDRIFFGTDSRLEAIAVGVLLAAVLEILRSRGRALPSWWARDAVLVVAAVVYVGSLVVRDPVFRDTLRYSLQAGAAAAGILWGLAEGNRGPLGSLVMRVCAWRPVQVIGFASYSVYLAHYVAMSALQGLGVPREGPFIALHVLVGTAVGVAVWKLVEVPVLDWRARHRLASSTQAR